MWIGESQIAQQETMRQSMGAPPRDVESWSEWRQSADSENLDLLSFYGSYLVNQHAGFSSALSLPAVVAALEIDGIKRATWPEMTERLIRLHLLYEQHRPKKES